MDPHTCQTHLQPCACLLQTGLTPLPWAPGGGFTLVQCQVPPEWWSGATLTENTASLRVRKLVQPESAMPKNEPDMLRAEPIKWARCRPDFSPRCL